MVREVMIGVLLCCALCRTAYADDEVSGVSGDTAVPVDYSARIDGVNTRLDNLHNDVDSARTEIVQHLMILEQQNVTLETVEDVPDLEEEEGQTETELLKEISENVKTMVPEDAPEIEVQQQVTDARATTAFVAYQNVSPTGQYATYASGLLPKVGWDEHYAYCQDTSSSYVMVWGDLTQPDANTISGTGKWVRWYYGGQNLGYLTEIGSGSVSVTSANHVIMSDLGSWPMLSASEEYMRKDVGFYVMVAAALFSLHTVLRFVTRLRGSTM